MEMELGGLVKFAAALVFVLALMGGLALALKRLGFGQPGLMTRAGRRLKLVEVLPIDARRKAVIIECDDEQHLVILGPAGETLIKNNLTKRVVSNEISFKDAA